MVSTAIRVRQVLTYLLLLGLAVWFGIMGWWIALAIEMVFVLAGFFGVAYIMVNLVLKRDIDASGEDVKKLAELCNANKYVIDAVEWLESGELWEMTSFDGLKLRGRFHKNGDSHTYAICCHGYKNHRMQDISNQAKHFYELGHNVFAGHARGHGLSEGGYIGMGFFERRDIVGWIDRIVQMDPEAKIFLYGVSMGGATVMVTSGEELPDNVKCVINDCGYSSIWDEFSYHIVCSYGFHVYPTLLISQMIAERRYGFGFKEKSALEQVAKTKLPFLFIHGDKDDFVPYIMMRPLFEACASEDKKSVTIKDSAHAENYYTDAETYWGEIKGWLDKYLV